MSYMYEHRDFYSLEKTKEIFSKLQKLDINSDEAKKIKEDIVLSHIGIITDVLKNKHYASISREDLYQVGILGLYLAIEQFKVEENVTFSTYSKHKVAGTIGVYIEKNEVGMSNVRNIRRAYSKVKKFKSDYYAKNGFFPAEEEIKEFIKNNEYLKKRFINESQNGELFKVIEGFDGNFETSLDIQVNEDNTIEDFISSDLTDYNKVIDEIDMKQLFYVLKNNLPPIVYYTIYYHFLIESKGFSDISQEFGVSRQSINHLFIRKKQQIKTIIEDYSKGYYNEILLNVKLEELDKYIPIPFERLILLLEVKKVLSNEDYKLFYNLIMYSKYDFIKFKEQYHRIYLQIEDSLLEYENNHFYDKKEYYRKLYIKKIIGDLDCYPSNEKIKRK